LEEFRTTVRDPIKIISAQLPKLARSIDGVAKTTSPIGDHEADLAELNRSVIDLSGDLTDALTDADTSNFANGFNWLDGMQDFEDALAECFNTARDHAKPQVDRLRSLERAKSVIIAFKQSIDSRIEAALVQYADDSESS